MEEREAALTRWMTQYGRLLHYVCMRYLRNETLAEDAVQDTLLKAWLHFDQFRGEASEKTWLVRIAVNTCKDQQRSGWARLVDLRQSIDDLPLTSPPPADDTLITLVMHLPPKYREVTLLVYYQGLSIVDTARTLHIPTPTAASRLRRARELLRMRLHPWDA